MRQSRLVHLNVSIPLKTKEQLESLAFKRQTSVSMLIREILLTWNATHTEVDNHGKASGEQG